MHLNIKITRKVVDVNIINKYVIRTTINGHLDSRSIRIQLRVYFCHGTYECRNKIYDNLLVKYNK